MNLQINDNSIIFYIKEYIIMKKLNIFKQKSIQPARMCFIATCNSN